MIFLLSALDHFVLLPGVPLLSFSLTQRKNGLSLKTLFHTALKNLTGPFFTTSHQHLIFCPLTW